MPSAAPTSVDYRRLMKKVEAVVAAIERTDSVVSTIQTVIESLITQFRDELGLYGGRFYRRFGDVFVLEDTFLGAKAVSDRLEVPASYPPAAKLLEAGLVFMDRDDPELDADLEKRLGTEEFAAIEVGDGRYILAFDVAPGYPRDDVEFSLGILRHAINQKVRQEQMEGILDDARKIQASILPKRSPEFGDFDIRGATESMERVGGDFYDYLPLTDKILGVAIADVSGHGLPAALQVRDIYMGLRMGMARDFKIVRTVERLNDIIHHSTLTSRFVSMFYGELELAGIFIYVNAGHPPPFHVAADGTARALEEGGAVLGPLPEGTYERGFVRLAPGDLLVLYTDGITEARRSGSDEEFGTERLLELVRENRRRPARKIVRTILDGSRGFAGGGPPGDDRTVVVVKRKGGEPG